MNARFLFPLICAAVALTAPAFAKKPPVTVEVIVEGEDDEDFFDEDRSKAAKPGSKDKSVRGRSDKLFEELEEKEGVRVRTRRGQADAKADGSSSTQVVNVIVQGAGAQSTQKEPPPASEATPAPASESPVISAGPGGAPPAPTAAEEDCDCGVVGETPVNWWDRPKFARRGDVLLSMSGGWSSAGGMLGLRLEGMATDRIGLQLRFVGTGFNRSDLNDDDQKVFLSSPEWGVGEIDQASVTRGFGHITDLALALHLFKHARFDLYPTIGISHFGYDIDLKSGPSRQGGSGLVRLGIGFNYHWRRMFAGFDFGWYPYEFVRYELVEDADGDRNAETIDVEDRFNSRRYVSSVHFGFKF